MTQAANNNRLYVVSAFPAGLFDTLRTTPEGRTFAVEVYAEIHELIGTLQPCRECGDELTYYQHNGTTYVMCRNQHCKLDGFEFPAARYAELDLSIYSAAAPARAYVIEGRIRLDWQQGEPSMPSAHEPTNWTVINFAGDPARTPIAYLVDEHAKRDAEEAVSNLDCWYEVRVRDITDNNVLAHHPGKAYTPETLKPMGGGADPAPDYTDDELEILRQIAVLEEADRDEKLMIFRSKPDKWRAANIYKSEIWIRGWMSARQSLVKCEVLAFVGRGWYLTVHGGRELVRLGLIGDQPANAATSDAGMQSAAPQVLNRYAYVIVDGNEISISRGQGDNYRTRHYINTPYEMTRESEARLLEILGWNGWIRGFELERELLSSSVTLFFQYQPCAAMSKGNGQTLPPSVTKVMHDARTGEFTLYACETIVERVAEWTPRHDDIFNEVVGGYWPYHMEGGIAGVMVHTRPVEDENPNPPMGGGDMESAVIDTSVIKIASGYSDGGAQHHAVQIARHLKQIGAWNGQDALDIYDAYSVSRKLRILGALTEGVDYTVGGQAFNATRCPICSYPMTIKADGTLVCEAYD